MKDLLKKFGNWLYRLLYYRKIRRYKRYESALEDAMLKKEKEKIDLEIDQIVLKVRIQKHVGKFLHVRARSRFIPHPVKNNEHICKEVYSRFGLEMAACGLTLKQDLTFCSTL